MSIPGDVIDGAAKGSSIEAGVTTGLDIAGTVAASVGGEAGAAVASAAGAAVGISTAIGSAIPIPLLGTAIGAIVGAFTALGIALKNLTADTFHPDAASALGWLLLFQIQPGLVFDSVDTINTKTENAQVFAARMVRYMRLVAGIVPPHGPLYNPKDTSSKSNSYIESTVPDPQEPLTDVAVTGKIGKEVVAAGSAASPKIHSMLKTPLQAQHALKLLRGKQFANSGVLGWEILNNEPTMIGLRASIANVRALAGEHGHDPTLEAIFKGDVTPREHRPAPAPKPHRAPTRPATVPPVPAHSSSATPSAPTDPQGVAPKQVPPGLVAVGIVAGVGAIAGLAWLFSSRSKG